MNEEFNDVVTALENELAGLPVEPLETPSGKSAFHDLPEEPQNPFTGQIANEGDDGAKGVDDAGIDGQGAFADAFEDYGIDDYDEYDDDDVDGDEDDDQRADA